MNIYLFQSEEFAPEIRKLFLIILYNKRLNYKTCNKKLNLISQIADVETCNKRDYLVLQIVNRKTYNKKLNLA